MPIPGEFSDTGLSDDFDEDADHNNQIEAFEAARDGDWDTFEEVLASMTDMAIASLDLVAEELARGCKQVLAERGAT